METIKKFVVIGPESTGKSTLMRTACAALSYALGSGICKRIFGKKWNGLLV